MRNSLNKIIIFSIFILLFGISNSNSESLTNSIFNGDFYYGYAQSAKSGKYWPCAISFYYKDEDSKTIGGILEWPTLNSVHGITGKVKDGKLLFREVLEKDVEIERKGRAHLKVRYKLTINDNKIAGTYKDPAGDFGTMMLKYKNIDGTPFNCREELLSGGVKKFSANIFVGSISSSKKITLVIDSSNATELQDFTGYMSYNERKVEISGIFLNGILTINDGDGNRYKLWYEDGYMVGVIYRKHKKIRGNIIFKLD